MSALTYAAARLLHVLPRRGISRAAGRLAEHRWSPPVERAVVGIYSRVYDVRFDDCQRERGWESFDEFFTRPLRDGARPVDPEPEAIVSPADGRLESMGTIAAGSTFHVKGRPYEVSELVGDEQDARRYEGGLACVIYLSPRDYHRVHAPVAGTITTVRSLPGDYFPVNSIGIRHVGNLFAINRRVAICIDTPAASGLGRVTVVMVAAIVVGRITVTGIDARDVPMGTHRIAPPVEVDRGDEIGVFHLGSTAVVFIEPGAAARWEASEGPILYGVRMAISKRSQARAGAPRNGVAP
jgi:phosphatidylserine decarboxylase